MAQLINLRLSRNDQSSPWGFRLQGGKDFGTPLLIQKVNFGSLAEKAGLQVGDALVRVNGQDVYDARHKDAQDIILGAGNAFEVTLQRGGASTWKPSVTPVGPSPVPNHLSQSPQLVTKTSLAKVGPQSPAFGSSHNSVTRPFSGTSSPKVHVNDSGTVKAIVNKQYNTPVGIYSEENIAETLTAQAEVLAGGVLGVNFKKNEKNYEVNQSEVFKMVQEADKEPKDAESEIYEGVIDPPVIKAPLRHVSAPEPKAPQSAPNQNACGDCERLIVGVFVRIKDKNLHVECFKCATCGSSLKNVGYFNINNKLYCDIHAKMVPKQIPVQTPNSEPVTVSPISQPSLGSFNTIPTLLKDVQSPRTNALSPIPFHTPSKVFTNATPYEAPKQTPAPPTFASGYNQVQTDEPNKSINSQPRLPFLKPKPSTGSVLSPVMSKSLTAGSSQCPNLSSQNVGRTLNQCKQILSESISTQMLIESSKKERTHSPPQKEETIIPEIPHEIRSLLPPNNNIQSISPTRFVVFPPEIPAEYRINCRSKTSSPQPKREINVETKSEYVISSLARKVDNTISQSTLERSESNNNQNFSENEYVRTNTSDIVSTHCHEINNETTIDCTNSSSVHSIETKVSPSTNECLEIIEPKYDQELYEPENAIATNNFSQEQSIPNMVKTEPIVESKLQVNFVEDDNIAESPMVAALKIAPERSYSPLPTFESASELIPKQIEPSAEPMTMADALVTAPDRSYKLLESNIKRPVGNNPVRYMHGYNNKKPVEPLLMTKSLIYAPTSAVDSEEEQIASLGLKSFPPISDELKFSAASGDFDQSNFENVELVFLKPETEESLNEEKDVVEPVVESIPKHPFTASGLHEPSDIPRYQRSIPENPHRATHSDKSSGKLIGPGIQDKVSSFTSKASIEDTSFPKQKPNEPSELVDSSSKNSDSIIYKLSYSEPNSSDYTPVDPIPKSHILSESTKESAPLTPHISETNYTLEEPVTPIFKSSLPAAFLSKKLTCLIKKQQPECIPTPIPIPDVGGQPTGRAGVSAGLTAPRRGRGVLNPQNLTPGAREPLCGQCNLYIRGPFITALGKIWCPEHFVCTNDKCKRPLQDIGFVEEANGLYCEYCFEQYLAPVCHKCSKKIKGDCLNAIGKQFHPECFNCAYCGKLFGNSPFFLEDSLPYCENDWNELFTTKCIACGFPIEAGDRWVEAMDKNYHSPCFNCSKCKTNLEGQSFFAKGGRPYCKSHAR